MSRYKRFTFLCDVSERHAIVELALRLQRSQSDAVRFVVMQAVQELRAGEPTRESHLTAYEDQQGGDHAIN